MFAGKVTARPAEKARIAVDDMAGVLGIAAHSEMDAVLFFSANRAFEIGRRINSMGARPGAAINALDLSCFD